MSDPHSTSDSASPILAHYATGYEAERLDHGVARLERVRTREIIARYLPPAPANVADVGGGPGGYAVWLAALGYSVQLLDVTPLHVEQARHRFEAEGVAANARADTGDARDLPYGHETQHTVLLLGPLYHLASRDDRIAALKEAYRVLKPGGVVIAAVISRYASLLDGFFRGFVSDPAFVEIMARDLGSGRHANPTNQPEYFTDAYFHEPEELPKEIESAGFTEVEVLAVEGPFWCLQNFDEVWTDHELREHMLGFLRRVEHEESLLGASAHILGIGTKPAP